jgi:hypothetical protein
MHWMQRIRRSTVRTKCIARTVAERGISAQHGHLLWIGYVSDPDAHRIGFVRTTWATSSGGQPHTVPVAVRPDHASTPQKDRQSPGQRHRTCRAILVCVPPYAPSCRRSRRVSAPRPHGSNGNSSIEQPPLRHRQPSWRAPKPSPHWYSSFFDRARRLARWSLVSVITDLQAPAVTASVIR